MINLLPGVFAVYPGAFDHRAGLLCVLVVLLLYSWLDCAVESGFYTESTSGAG